jgi:hypothetical protein
VVLVWLALCAIPIVKRFKAKDEIQRE